MDRLTGPLISVEPFIPASWATGIDIASGRPIKNPGTRYESGSAIYNTGCVVCHSDGCVAATRTAPDLRLPGAIVSQANMDTIRQDGTLFRQGRPRIMGLLGQERTDVRQLIRSMGGVLRRSLAKAPTPTGAPHRATA